MIERVLALAVLAGSVGYLTAGWPLPRGDAARPGPGFYPMAVGVFGAAVALAWAVSAFRRAPAGGEGTLAGPGLGRVGVTAALLLGFCLALPWSGYPAAALLFVGLLLRGLGAGWTGAAVVAVATAGVSYYFFGTVLGVPLPRGLLFD